MRKGAGFVFTEDELITLISKIRGKEYPRSPNWTNGIIQFMDVCEHRRMGYLRFISLFKGMDEHEKTGYIRSWMLVARVRELDENETPQEFEDIPFEPEHPGTEHVINCMKDYGYSEEELGKKWMTLSEWYFMEH